MSAEFERLAALLAAELGRECVDAAPTGEGPDGRGPELICKPNSSEQLALALRLCAESKCAVSARGGATGTPVGNLALRSYVSLDVRRLNRILEHDHANLTATAQCGVTLAALHSALSPQKQFLPIDVPAPEKATLGGTIAMNLNGPRRGFYGGMRDLVIGIKAVLVTGEEIKAGGKVVKNVAGYDMCKLFTGSMGTLGIITETTVRLAPVPELSSTIVVSGEWREAIAFLDTVAATPLVPAAVTLLNDGGEDDKWRVAVWCEGLEQDVTRHLRDVETVAGRIGAPVETLRDEAQTVFWGKIRDMPLAADRCVYRLIVPRAGVESCIDALKVLGPPAPAVAGDTIAGTLWLSWPAESEFAARFPDLIALATAHRGHAVLFAAPEHLKENIDVWGPPPASIGIMQKIKQEFDPGGVLNPDIFLGGL